jgi:hypothetical protein
MSASHCTLTHCSLSPTSSLLYLPQVYTQTPEDVNRYLSSEDKSLFSASLAAQQNMKLGERSDDDSYDDSSDLT